MRELERPAVEPVSVEKARKYLRLPKGFRSEDDLIEAFIAAARELGEIETGRALAQRRFTMVLDAHPYYTDTIQSQLAYPPSYYMLPKYSTTLWNYSQMIKLTPSPVVSVDLMRSIKPDGSVRTMQQDTDFILDRISEPARVFPLPGQYWPPDLYVANALEIQFTAGYDSDTEKVDVHSPAAPPSSPGQQPDSTLVTGVPQLIILGILNLVMFWWNNRGQAGTVPDNIRRIFQQCAIQDWALTRG